MPFLIQIQHRICLSITSSTCSQRIEFFFYLLSNINFECGALFPRLNVVLYFLLLLLLLLLLSVYTTTALLPQPVAHLSFWCLHALISCIANLCISEYIHNPAHSPRRIQNKSFMKLVLEQYLSLDPWLSPVCYRWIKVAPFQIIH